MELPGVEEANIDITVNSGVVSVKGEKSATREEAGETWFFSERQYGAFSRSFRLPEDADGDGIEAELKDGVLQIIVPKRAPDAPEETRITIKRG
jgi:HSP20 family protein